MVTADIPATIMIYKELLSEFRTFSPRSGPLPEILLLANGTNIYPPAKTRKLRVTINPSLPPTHRIQPITEALSQIWAFLSILCDLAHVMITFSPELLQEVLNGSAHSTELVLQALLHVEQLSQFLTKSLAYWKVLMFVLFDIKLKLLTIALPLPISLASSYTQSLLSLILSQPAPPLTFTKSFLVVLPYAMRSLRLLFSSLYLVNSYPPQVLAQAIFLLVRPSDLRDQVRPPVRGSCNTIHFSLMAQ